MQRLTAHLFGAIAQDAEAELAVAVEARELLPSTEVLELLRQGAARLLDPGLGPVASGARVVFATQDEQDVREVGHTLALFGSDVRAQASAAFHVRTGEPEQARIGDEIALRAVPAQSVVVVRIRVVQRHC